MPPSPTACLRWHAAPAWRRSTRCSRWAGQQRTMRKGRDVGRVERAGAVEQRLRQRSTGVVRAAWAAWLAGDAAGGMGAHGFLAGQATKASGGVACDAPGAQPDAIASAAAPFSPCRMRQAPTCRAFWALKSGRLCPQVRLCGERACCGSLHQGTTLALCIVAALWQRQDVKAAGLHAAADSWATSGSCTAPILCRLRERLSQRHCGRGLHAGH